MTTEPGAGRLLLAGVLVGLASAAGGIAWAGSQLPASSATSVIATPNAAQDPTAGLAGLRQQLDALRADVPALLQAMQALPRAHVAGAPPAPVPPVVLPPLPAPLPVAAPAPAAHARTGASGAKR